MNWALGQAKEEAGVGIQGTKRTNDPARIKAEILSDPLLNIVKWLKAHKTWSHDDWLKLLDDLKAKGYGNLVGEKAGQDSVGLYLETNRNQ